ncbi:hypothetical protein PF005_g28916 [Phytophthora fragariae]|uniref:Uncharacterized protein n=1 Tax=Phytophthora fragariae TaxID=53985 RepID=A0A6A3QGZ0_9STRA|nr:hypothetical protein PF003_g36479 [Phytophthora fragariae]KAE8920560.1 hypothetical protein PF009_g29147 [Phytophthora fragariae]KAE8970945.1 hypothetical protein PF011_g26220 [Phytophthora fragariae]KAE9066235.1 hypothetical protein PF010_g27887 [Phytophthora fragariae]KAE9066314.1 hypothetical protein PF007_g28519 [Phytophthora fragariae]
MHSMLISIPLFPFAAEGQACGASMPSCYIRYCMISPPRQPLGPQLLIHRFYGT